MSKSFERRKYLRLEAPVKLRVVTSHDKVYRPTVKNFSTLGIRFLLEDRPEKNEELDLTLYLPSTKNPVHVGGKIVWMNEASESGATVYDVGCEFTDIEEDNKNTFLKCLCDLIYAKAITIN